MKRTNIYLETEQAAALEAMSKREGVSRAELIRRILDQKLRGADANVEADLAAILESAGVLADEDVAWQRQIDGRANHLQHLNGE